MTVHTADSASTILEVHGKVHQVVIQYNSIVSRNGWLKMARMFMRGGSELEGIGT